LCSGWSLMSSTMSLPPGLLDVSNPVQYIETSSGGDGAWLAFTSKKLYTNAFIVSPGPPRKVAPVLKPVAIYFLHSTRRFCLATRNADLVRICELTYSPCGASAIHQITPRYNGFGGKVEDGELPAQAAARELKVCTLVLDVEFTGHLTGFSSHKGGMRYRGSTQPLRNSHFYQQGRTGVGVSDRALSRRYLQRDFDRVCLFFPLFFHFSIAYLMRIDQDRRDAT
jgi:hypothetical protein